MDSEIRIHWFTQCEIDKPHSVIDLSQSEWLNLWFYWGDSLKNDSMWYQWFNMRSDNHSGDRSIWFTQRAQSLLWWRLTSLKDENESTQWIFDLISLIESYLTQIEMEDRALTHQRDISDFLSMRIDQETQSDIRISDSFRIHYWEIHWLISGSFNIIELILNQYSFTYFSGDGSK